MTRSGVFFAQSFIKRWDRERNLRRPGLDQLFTALRNGEREWNSKVGEHAVPESYAIPAMRPLYVTAEPALTGPNPLDKQAYNRQRGVTYSWRSSYYSQYGYPTYR